MGRRLAPITGIVTGVTMALATPLALASDTHWQVQGANITVVADDSKELAAQAADMIVRMRRIVAWEAGWPETYQPPAVIAFALHSSVIEEYFGKSVTPQDDYLQEFRTVSGLSVALGATNVIIFPIRGERGSEVEALKLLYVKSLLESGPTAKWPKCVRFGLSVAATSAHVSKGVELYVPADEVTFPLQSGDTALGPIDIMGSSIPVNEAVQQRTRRGYSCYVLALMALRGENYGRPAYQTYFASLADGMALEEASQAAFGVAEHALTTQMKAFGYKLGTQPRPLSIRTKLEIPTLQWSVPQPLATERVNQTLLALREKLKL